LGEKALLDAFNLVVDADLLLIQARRIAAQNPDLTEVQIAQAILSHHELMLAHACNATTRLQQRLLSIRLAANVLEAIIVNRLETATLDIANLRNAVLNNLTTVILAETLYTILFDYRNALWTRLNDVETFKHQIDIYIVKIDRLLFRKCVLNMEVLAEISDRIKAFTAAEIVDIQTLKSYLNNQTRMEIVLDVVYDYITELKQLNVTFDTTFVDYVILHHKIAQLFTDIKENVGNASTVYCDGIRPLLVAHFGLRRADVLCDPSTATPLVNNKRQLDLVGGEPEIDFSLDVTGQTASTPTSVPSGTVALAMSFVSLTLFLSTFLV